MPEEREQASEGIKVRIYRTPAPYSELVLEDGQGLWNLTAYLEAQGQPTTMVDLFESGWFERDRLLRVLPARDHGWTPSEVPAQDGRPLEVGLPLGPRQVGKILCLGKNFRAHAEEFGEEVPSEPLFFNKLPETLVPHQAEVQVPGWYEARVDHEAELCAVIGLGGRDIEVDDAMEHVAGYTVANDLTARSIQGWDREKQYPWFRAKNLDGFCPLGPCFVPRDFLDLAAQQVTAHVNGELRQDASTADWIVKLPEAIAWLSKHLTLRSGDLILTGTPAGVGPLKDGDEVVCRVSGIGSLHTRILRPGKE